MNIICSLYLYYYEKYFRLKNFLDTIFSTKIVARNIFQ